MNNQNKRHQIITRLVLGLGLTFGVATPAVAFPDNSRIYSDYYNNHHRRTFRKVQPFRSLNVTPRYYIPLPDPRSPHYEHHHHHKYHHRGHDYRYHNSDRTRERRVHRRDYRVPTESHQNREYRNEERTRVRRVHRRNYRVPGS